VNELPNSAEQGAPLVWMDQPGVDAEEVKR
jgi:hypothetical protein